MEEERDQQIWAGLVDADRLTRYYSRLADRFSRHNRWAMLTVSFFSTLAIISVFAEWLMWISAGVSGIAASIALWVAFYDLSRRAGVAAFIASACMDLTAEWEQLWYRPGEAEDWSRRVRELTAQANKVTSVALLQHGFGDKKLEEQCAKEAQNYWREAINPQNA